MQLKRDTDYAMRIICCLIFDSARGEISVSEISRKTQIPKVVVVRVCNALCEKGIIAGNQNGKENSMIHITKETYSKSLFDIIEAIEHQTDLFAIFDKNSDMFTRCGSCFHVASISMDACLKNITIACLADHGRALLNSNLEIISET